MLRQDTLSQIADHRCVPRARSFPSRMHMPIFLQILRFRHLQKQGHHSRGHSRAFHRRERSRKTLKIRVR